MPVIAHSIYTLTETGCHWFQGLTTAKTLNSINIYLNRAFHGTISKQLSENKCFYITIKSDLFIRGDCVKVLSIWQKCTVLR